MRKWEHRCRSGTACCCISVIWHCGVWSRLNAVKVAVEHPLLSVINKSLSGLASKPPLLSPFDTTWQRFGEWGPLRKGWLLIRSWWRMRIREACFQRGVNGCKNSILLHLPYDRTVTTAQRGHNFGIRCTSHVWNWHWLIQRICCSLKSWAKIS